MAIFRSDENGALTPLDTGKPEPVETAPAAEPQEVVEPAADNGGEVAASNGQKEAHEDGKKQSRAENAAFAAARRRAEAEFRQRIEQMEQENQKFRDSFIARQGIIDAETGKPITTQAEFDAYQAKQDQQRQDKQLEKSGLSRQLLNDLVSQNPGVQAAMAAAQQEKDRAEAERVKTVVQGHIDQITQINPDIKSLDDLREHPMWEQISTYVTRNSLNVYEAYKLATGEVMARQAAASQAKADAIRDAGKSHLQHDAASGSGSNEIELSYSEMEKMRSFWPHASDEEIRTMAKKVAKFRKKV